MKLLGLDYGKRKIGLAIADGPLADPFNVLRVSSMEEAVRKVVEVTRAEKIERVVVGISEGAMAEETAEFVSFIRSALPTIPIETFDETLTTQDAQKLAIEAGVPRLKRKSLEDAFAAAVMLQSYLDAYV